MTATFLFNENDKSIESNYIVSVIHLLMKKVENILALINLLIDRIDIVNLRFSEWHINLRASDTESLLHLNVESQSKRIN